MVRKIIREFFVPGEKLDLERFKSLGVIESKKAKPLAEVQDLFNNLNTLFAKRSFTKRK